MREIKFRGWNGEKMLMYSSWFTLNRNETLCFEEPPHNYVDDSDVDYPTRIIPMQYTGLLDKHGKEIYEGDIVNGASFNGSYAYGKIIYWKDRYVIKPIGRFVEGIADLYYHVSCLEVIGNEFENPELLN